ncbi:tetratricopeptide repeat protein [Lujinxingia vulgaris]|uniref:Tetratricopeptide repeat protein n=1 Tax=Lujinxingia vulgaris TaxID=2600176 RepID=A0A5C6X710_9DELT|nr:tetratricopeptide repeat protein [Lujinxingia vulgaris]TXD33795.1 tetratricopeptide repeat protein [Lujinxingia vulgaris]
MKFYPALIFTLLLSFVSSPAFAQNIDHAIDLYNHALNDEAKLQFLAIKHDRGAANEHRSEAMYWLGQIAFEESRYAVALGEWEALVSDYPNSERANEIETRLSELGEVLAEHTSDRALSAVASSWLRNGDFWSGSDRTFTIDSSWLPKLEQALHWYDRVIAEFPGTPAAEAAYARKLFALLGWETSGRYGSSYGLKLDFKLITAVTETFAEFEEQFPENPQLQGFRFQIAQAYWGKRQWNEARTWLNRIIEVADGTQTFYTETARQRLEHLEY